jgi:hypothetical protein
MFSGGNVPNFSAGFEPEEQASSGSDRRAKREFFKARRKKRRG